MKRTILVISALVILGVIYWLVSPFFIDKKVSEDFPLTVQIEEDNQVLEENKILETENPTIVSTGVFEGFDKVHHGEGTAKLIKVEDTYTVRFENDFFVANGPDLYVGLGKDGEYKKETQLSALKGNIGSQNYSIPASIDVSDYNEVWIWCRAFSVPFAKATLIPE